MDTARKIQEALNLMAVLYYRYKIGKGDFIFKYSFQNKKNSVY